MPITSMNVEPGDNPRRDRAGRRLALFLCTVFGIVSIAAAFYGRARGPDIPYFLPPLGIVWSVCDLLTAFLFLSQFSARRRIGLAVLGLAYFLTALLTWPYLAAYVGLFGTATRTLGAQQIPPSLYLLWHDIFPVAVVAACWLEDRNKRIVGSLNVRYVIAALVATVALISGLIAFCVFAWPERLPILVIDGVFQPIFWSVGIPSSMVLSAGGCVWFLKRPERLTGLRLWLAVALFTSFLDALMNESSPIRSSYAWDFGKIMTVMTSVIVLFGLLRAVNRMYAQASDMIGLQSRQAAARLRALWQIVTSDGLNEQDHVQMILDVATGNIRPPNAVFGYLSHLESGRIIVDAVSESGFAAPLEAAARTYLVGQDFALGDDVTAAIYAASRTCHWDSLPASFGSYKSAAAAWHSVIGTPIQIGNRTHFLIFGIPVGQDEGPFSESDTAFVEVVASNISHRFHSRKQLERIKFQIEHDALTDLYNRSQFHRSGRLAIADGTLVAIAVINLDQFRSINERVGPMIGDELLVEIASHLKLVAERDVVARIDGDDFGVLLKRDEPAEPLSNRLAAYESIFTNAFHTGDRDGKVRVPVSASLGAVDVCGSDLKFEAALTRANVALANSKEKGGGCLTIFGPELEATLFARSVEDNDLRKAISGGELRLAYQPTVELNSRTFVSAEALIRWAHPSRGLLAPGQFLPVANRAQLLVDLTLWVVGQLAIDLKGSVLPPGFRCYFNVPAHVLENGPFLAALELILEESPGLAPRLGLEITESDVMNKVEQAIVALNHVRRLGILVAIDDFGTGYSSLSYLKRLPVDVIKLDKSFIDGLPRDKRDVGLAKMFLGLSSQFSLVSVGEGIERDEQAEWLLANGCMIGQGFLFSRPVSFEAMLRLVVPRIGSDIELDSISNQGETGVRVS